MKDKISVIIPVYNMEKYLEECVKSVVEQTYTNLEILLIDDGSKDNSGTMCDKLSLEDNRIKVFHKTNGGLSDARNYGIKKATGKYLFFLDSDDLIQSDALELMYSIIYKEKDSIAICKLEQFQEKYSNDKIHDIKVFSPYEYFLEILMLKNFTYACGVLLQKKMINNSFFIKGRYFEDMGSMYKLFDKSRKIYKINANFYKYRMQANSIIHTANKKKTNDFFQSANEMVNYIREHYNIPNNIYNTFLCEIAKTCYIMCREKKYLEYIKNNSSEISLRGLSLKNKLKMIAMKNTFILRFLIFFKYHNKK